MAIYTKGGDKGSTSLVGGQRVSKQDPRLEAYGSVDELNSFIGMARELARADAKLGALVQPLEVLQHWLFDLGSLLASTPEDRKKYQLRPLTAEHVKWMETQIDSMTSKLPALKNFILPGGSQIASALHVARTVARRAERHMTRDEISNDLPEHAIPFINRLSDYLFTAARYSNLLLGVVDITWERRDP